MLSQELVWVHEEIFVEGEKNAMWTLPLFCLGEEMLKEIHTRKRHFEQNKKATSKTRASYSILPFPSETAFSFALLFRFLYLS